MNTARLQVNTRISINYIVIVAITSLICMCSSSVRAGLPFSVDDPGSEPYGLLTVYSAYMSNHDDGAYVSSWPSETFAYGVSQKTELDLGLGRVEVRDGDGTKDGMGDSSVSVKYRFQEETMKNPQLAFFTSLSIPTGGDMGAGFYSSTSYFCAAKQLGKGTLMADFGVNYFNSPSEISTLYGVAYPIILSKKATLGPQVYGYGGGTASGKSEFAFGIGGTYQMTKTTTAFLELGHSLIDSDETIVYAGFSADFKP
jgi:hypothetical protein